MPTDHTVKQGEHVARIAMAYGLMNTASVWDHPDNAQLKQRRGNPNVLFPGDHLLVPDKQAKQQQGATQQRHRFRVAPLWIELRLVVEEADGEPVADTPCRLVVEGDVHQLQTDDMGRICQRIAKTAETAKLIIQEVEIPIKIGHLDPVDQRSGQIARLDNLGYNASAAGDKDEAQFLLALEEFQCDHGLTVDGICGPNTQAKLQEVHGC